METLDEIIDRMARFDPLAEIKSKSPYVIDRLTDDDKMVIDQFFHNIFIDNLYVVSQDRKSMSERSVNINSFPVWWNGVQKNRFIETFEGVKNEKMKQNIHDEQILFE
jgi:hypothetical protein